MPSTSQKQHNLMAAVANSPAFAKKTGIPQSVGEDFTSADKGIKFKGGSSSRPDLQRINEKNTRHGKMELFNKGGDTMASKMNPGFMAMMAKKKAGAQEGSKKDMMADKAQMMGMKKGGAAKKMASGGLAAGHKSADGIATKGKTKGMQVKMNKGGKTC